MEYLVRPVRQKICEKPKRGFRAGTAEKAEGKLREKVEPVHERNGSGSSPAGRYGRKEKRRDGVGISKVRKRQLVRHNSVCLRRAVNGNSLPGEEHI
jgi:hypothetical protein